MGGGADLILVDVVLSDKLIEGNGGVVLLTLLLTEEELETILDLAQISRATHRPGSPDDPKTRPEKYLFRGSSGCLIDTRCIVGITPVIGEEDDGGGGEELDPDDPDDAEEVTPKAEANPYGDN